MRCKVLITFLLLSVIGLPDIVRGQEKPRKSRSSKPLAPQRIRPLKEAKIPVWLFGPHYTSALPSGDLGKRYGWTHGIGGTIQHKLKSNWLLGVDYRYLSTGVIREKGILDIISTHSANPDERYIINARGEYEIMKQSMRGHLLGVMGGHIFNGLGPNPNSGISVKAGAGYMLHYIYYYSVGDGAPQLQGDYVKGYDRRSGGYAATLGAGYYNFSNSGMVNFSAELEATLGFTQGLRAWQFDLMRRDDAKRKDWLLGAKFSWYFPYYRRNVLNNEFY